MVFPKPIEEQTSKPTQSLELLERALELLKRAFGITNSGCLPGEFSPAPWNYPIANRKQ